MVWTRSEITGGCFHMDELARRLRRRLTVIAALGLVVTLATNGLRGDPFLIAAAGKGCSADFQKFCSQQHASKTDQATCLRQYWVSLSQECRRSLGSSKGSSGASGEDTGGGDITK
jgi:hypothetical protein